MDIRRTVIFIGLAVTSYLLILAWSDDYGQKPQTSTPVAVESNTTETVNNDVPDTSDAQSAQPNITTDDSPALAATQNSQANSDQVIQVKTDVLEVSIDLVGGEVIAAKLPEYPASIDNKDVPFSLLDSSSNMTYTAQSGLLGRDGIDKNTPATYSAEQKSYQLADGQEELVVVLTAADDKAQVEKVFTFKRNEYLIDVNYKVHNTADAPWQGVFYAQLKRDNAEDPSAGNSLGMKAYLGAALTTEDDRYKKVKFSELEKKGFKSVETGGWAAMLQHYFLSAWVPANQDAQYTYNGRANNGNNYFGFYSTPQVVNPGESKEMGASLYVGPKIQKRLAEISEHLNLTVDYGWLWWIAQPLFWLLTFYQSIVGNWGAAIIMLTISIKILFFKPSAMSYRSMANMRKVAPKMQEIKETYADNREKLGQEMMKLYKDEKINPLGGCLPILIQMPVFIALYWVIMESVELRQAPFIFWIKDMSVMDPYFILPLIMGASMFFQMKLNPTPPDPMQARVMQFMPVVFTVFFLWFPAGLVLYWVVNNLLSIAQQYVITKQIENS